MSMGALLLAGGAEGKRTLPNSKILIHQVWGGYQGQASDIEIHARDNAFKRKLEEIMAHHTGQDVDKVRTDMDRDYFMTAEEATEYGIIDRVIVHHREPGSVRPGSRTRIIGVKRRPVARKERG